MSTNAKAKSVYTENLAGSICEALVEILKERGDGRMIPRSVHGSKFVSFD